MPLLRDFTRVIRSKAAALAYGSVAETDRVNIVDVSESGNGLKYMTVADFRQALMGFLKDGLLSVGTLAIDATPEKFKTTATAYYRITGIQYSKAATTALVFSASHVVTASKYGIVLVQVNAAGTVSTKVPASTQAYNSAPLALAALPAVDSGKVALGYIAIANNAGDWTANTDDLTDGSDLTTATFVDASVFTRPTEFQA